MITFRHKGDFKKTYSFLEKALEVISVGFLDKYGREGVEALSRNTPKDSGLAASSWYYRIIRDGKRVSIEWCNSDIENGVNVAVILQYGHATKNGGWVEGIDYVNPAIRPIFERIAEESWKEMTNS